MNLNIPGYTGTGGGFTTGGGLNIPAMGNANIPVDLATATAGGTSGFGQIVGGIGDIFGGLMGAGQQVLGSPNALMGLAGGLLTREAYDRLSDIGAQARSGAIEIAEQGQAESQFRPFTVTTPTGAMFTARMGGQPSMGQPMPQPVSQPSMMLPQGDRLFRPGDLEYRVGGPAPDTSRQDALLRQLQQQLINSGYQPPGANQLRQPISDAREGAFDELRSKLGIDPGQPFPAGVVTPDTSYMPPTPFTTSGPMGYLEAMAEYNKSKSTPPTPMQAPTPRVLEGLMTRDVFPTPMQAPAAPPTPTMPTMPAPFRPSGDPVEEFSQIGDSPIAGFPLPKAVPDVFPNQRNRDSQPLSEILDQLTGITPVVSFPQTGVATQQPTAPAGEGLEIGMTLSPEEQRLQQQLLGGAGTFFGQAAQPTTSREQAIFERMRAAQRPEEERQRLALEERLAAQGRLGTSSAAYGGATPELLALSTAEREARDRSMLTAMQQAQAEQAQQAALGGQFLGAGYLPQQQLIAALQPGLIQQELAQQAQQFGTGLFGETALSGIEAQLLAEQARANLLGGIGSNVISGLINQQRAASAAPSGSSSLGGLFSSIAGGLGSIGSGIADILGIGG